MLAPRTSWLTGCSIRAGFQSVVAVEHRAYAQVRARADALAGLTSCWFVASLLPACVPARGPCPARTGPRRAGTARGCVPAGCARLPRHWRGRAAHLRWATPGVGWAFAARHTTPRATATPPAGGRLHTGAIAPFAHRRRPPVRAVRGGRKPPPLQKHSAKATARPTAKTKTRTDDPCPQTLPHRLHSLTRM
jgi:hypothetical protein